MKKLLITEKPSVAMEFAKVLKVGANKKNGYIEMIPKQVERNPFLHKVIKQDNKVCWAFGYNVLS